MAALYRNDLDALVTGVIAQPKTFFGRLDYVHISLARVVDQRHAVPEEILTSLAEYGAGRELRFLEALARRGLGVLHGRTDELREALAMFESIRSRPFVARVQAELGRATGDSRLVDEGLAELEQLGDVAQIERMVSG